MNIALVIFHADPARGGAERYTVDLAAVLAQRGHNVSLIASSFGSPIEAVSQHKLSASAATRLGAYLRFLDSLDSHLEATAYDVIHAMLPVRHCHIYHPHAGLAAEAITAGHLKHNSPLKKKLARLSNRFNRKRQRFAAVERRLLESPNPPLVLCLSDYVKTTVKSHFPHFPENRLAKLFNATDLVRFNPASRPDAGASIREKFGIHPQDILGLLIAQDFERKGLKEAITALSKIPDPRLKLLVVGKQDVSRYRQLAESSGIASRVSFAGATNDPYAFYKAADFFILPTWHDPCSLVVLESLAMGVPVISTALNGACEVMKTGVHGFILPSPSDEPALAAALLGMTDAESRRRMAKACLELRPALSYDRHLEALDGLYKQIK